MNTERPKNVEVENNKSIKKRIKDGSCHVLVRQSPASLRQFRVGLAIIGEAGGHSVAAVETLEDFRMARMN